MLRRVTRDGHYLSCGSRHHQLARVLAESDLLDAKPGVIAVRVKAADLKNTMYNMVLDKCSKPI